MFPSIRFDHMRKRRRQELRQFQNLRRAALDRPLLAINGPSG